MSFLHPAGAIESTGMYDAELGIFEDWDYLLRLAQQYPFVQVKRPTCEYRFRFGSQTNDSTLLHRQQAQELRTRMYARYPTEDEEIQRKRAMTIAAMRQQINDVQQIQGIAP